MISSLRKGRSNQFQDMLIDESTLKHDDNATAASDAPTDDGQTRSQNAPTNDGQPTLTLVTDFSGMETPSQALIACGVKHVLLSASEMKPALRRFIITNFQPVEIRHDAWMEPDLRDGCQPDLYVAGFPCQTFSGLGKRQGVDDEQGRGICAEVCIHRIAKLQPKAFILENVTGARTAHGGDFWRNLTTQLLDEGYTLDDCIFDAINAGSPQTRRRVYLVGRRGRHGPLAIAGEREPIDIETILDPREPGDDHMRAPRGKHGGEIDATRRVVRERDRLNQLGISTETVERVLNIDDGRVARSTPKVSCLLASRKYGFWLMSRGRKMRAHEALKAQGVTPALWQWPELDSDILFMAGNAMNLRVLSHIYAALLPAIDPDFKVAQLPRFQQQDHAEFIVNRNRKGEKKSTPEYLRKRGYKDMFSPLKLRGRTNSYFNINAERCRASFKGIDAEGRRNPGATRAPHHSYSVGTDNTNASESKTKQARQRLLWDTVDTPQDGLQGSDDHRMVGAAPTLPQAKDSDQDRQNSTLSGAPLSKEGAHECDLPHGFSVRTSSAAGTSRPSSSQEPRSGTTHVSPLKATIKRRNPTGNLSKLNKRQLQEIAINNGIDSGGTVPQLVQRLRTQLRQSNHYNDQVSRNQLQGDSFNGAETTGCDNTQQLEHGGGSSRHDSVPTSSDDVRHENHGSSSAM